MILRFLLGNPESFLNGKTPALRKLLSKGNGPSPRKATGRFLKHLFAKSTQAAPKAAD
jgi:hypothetical protein